MECKENDLYGRILCKVYIKSDPNKNIFDICVNDEMIKSKLVFIYDNSSLTKLTLQE